MSTNLSDWLHIRYANGIEGHVLPESLADPKLAENFAGAHVLGNADGTDYSGPTTAEGMLRHSAAAVAARREARAARHPSVPSGQAARAAEQHDQAEVAEAEQRPEPVPAERE